MSWWRRWRQRWRLRWKLGGGSTTALEHDTLVVKTTINRRLLTEAANDEQLAALIADDVREIAYLMLRARIV